MKTHVHVRSSVTVLINTNSSLVKELKTVLIKFKGVKAKNKELHVL